MNICPIPSYEGFYSASDQGEIFSHVSNKVLSPASLTSGYLKVTLCKDGKKTQMLVHRLVLMAFVGPPNEGQESRHFNGIHSDNRLSNLSWATHFENMQDNISHGKTPRGNKSKTRKLSLTSAKEIYEKYKKGGISQYKLAKEYGVSQATISLLSSGITWPDIHQ